MPTTYKLLISNYPSLLNITIYSTLTINTSLPSEDDQHTLLHDLSFGIFVQYFHITIGGVYTHPTHSFIFKLAPGGGSPPPNIAAMIWNVTPTKTQPRSTIEWSS